MKSFFLLHLSTSLDLGYIIDIYPFLVFQFFVVASPYLSYLYKFVVIYVAIFTNLVVFNSLCLLVMFSQSSNWSVTRLDISLTIIIYLKLKLFNLFVDVVVIC